MLGNKIDHLVKMKAAGFRVPDFTVIRFEDMVDATGFAELIKTKLSNAESACDGLQEMEDEKARILIQAEGVSEEMLDKSFQDLKGYFDQKVQLEERPWFTPSLTYLTKQWHIPVEISEVSVILQIPKDEGFLIFSVSDFTVFYYQCKIGRILENGQDL